MVLSFVPMSILDQMVAPKALVSLPSNLRMMLAMQSSNSTAMIGKVARLKFVKTVLLALVLDLADEVALALGVVSVVASVVAEASAVVEDLAVDLAVVEEALEVAMEALRAVVLMLERLLHPPTPSLTISTAGTERGETIYVRNVSTPFPCLKRWY